LLAVPATANRHRVKRVLGWEPTVPLETGLRLSLDYFLNGIEAEKMKVVA
jgi:nucleoside-diphosphate-sugar epimerase